MEIGLGQGIRFYSERGVMSHYLGNLDSGRLERLMAVARNLDGLALADAIGCPVGSYRVYTEFELGSEGFGSPDGGILVRTSNGVAFVFIEAKCEPYAHKYADPTAKKVAKNYNSSINGQLELKWRFVNAFLARPDRRDFLVSEQFLPKGLPDSIRNTDGFYKSSKRSDRTKISSHRRVALSETLKPLYDDLLSVTKGYYMLAVTTDEELPRGLADVRLFTPDGQPDRDAATHLFWVPHHHLTSEGLTCVTPELAAYPI